MMKSLMTAGLGLSMVLSAHAAVANEQNMQLNYKSNGSAYGIGYSGKSVLSWEQKAGRYKMSLKTSNLMLSFTQSSSGLYSSQGLKPLNYQERKNRQAFFHYDTGLITFKDRDEKVKIQSGAQDRVSAVMQLSHLFRSGALSSSTGKHFSIQIAGTHSAPVWRFEIRSPQQVKVPFGSVNAIQVTKVSSSDGKTDILNVWLVPDRDWLPVKLEFSRGDSIYALMQLESIK